jgi:oligopeptide/dipeptide ABC transporter ATP-binding protein
MSNPILEIKDLKKYFPVKSGMNFFGKAGWVKAVDGISFSISEGETFGLVGESGSGKSTIGRLVLKVLEATSGEIRVIGYNLKDLSGKDLFLFRRNIQAVYQNPYGSLNPRMKVGTIIGEPLETHKLLFSKRKEERVRELLKKVGLFPEHAKLFPHEFSGGQRQRIGIARALSTNPKFVILDEPVSALDVSIRAQILNLLSDLKDEFGLTYLFISHDLSIVEHFSDRVGVLYLGRIVELASKIQLFKNPSHPYTKALFSAVPIADPDRIPEALPLSGEIPSPINTPPGCHFNTRCPSKMDICEKDPPCVEIEEGHIVYCHFSQ